MFFNFQSDGIFKGVKCKYPGPSERERGWGKGLINPHPQHWDFLPKFLSLHYYTILEGVLGVQRCRKAQ